MWYSISAEVFAQERNKIMSEYGISQIYPTDRYSNDQVDKLLLAEGIRRDGNLDYTCGMYDDDMNIIATGSCFGNTLHYFESPEAAPVLERIRSEENVIHY